MRNWKGIGVAVTSAIRVDRQRFAREGYLVIENVFDPSADLDPVVREYAAQLDEIAADWHARGLIESAYADLSFSERFGHVLNDAGPEGYRPFDITLSGPVADDSPMHTGPAVFSLITHPRLLDVESHTRGLLLHCPSRPGQVFDLKIPEVVRRSNGIPVEMKRGTALFMHRLMMHSSLRNLSNAVRWSFDLRYQPVGQPTGRDWLPAFVARSRADPRQEIQDWRRWAEAWWQARDYVAANPGAQKPRRWTGTEAECA